MGGSRKFCGGGGGVMTTYFSHQRISQRVVRTSLKKQLDTLGPIASRRGSVPVFLRKSLATSDFPGGGGGAGPPVPHLWTRPCIREAAILSKKLIHEMIFR